MKKLIKNVAIVLQAEECKFVIIGAYARDLFFEQRGIELNLSTKDVDFAVLIDDWEDFEKIKNALIMKLGFKASDRFYRLIFNYTPIDLLPFGKIQDSNCSVRWPTGFRENMKVMGFKEAYENSVLIEIEEVKIRTIIPEMLVALKISSWSHGDRVKDAIDIMHVLKNVEALCPDLLLDESLFNKELESKYITQHQKVIFKFALKIMSLVDSSMGQFLENVFQSNYNKRAILTDMNESVLPLQERLKELEFLVDPFVDGIITGKKQKISK